MAELMAFLYFFPCDIAGSVSRARRIRKIAFFMD